MDELDGYARQRFALQRLEDGDCLESRAFAWRARAMVDLAAAAVASERAHQREQFVAGEVAATSTIALGSATAELHRSQHLVHSLPGTWQALDEGWLRVHQALVLMRETLLLSDDLCRQVEQLVLPDVEGRTSSSLLRVVRRVIARLQDDEHVARRRKQAFEARRVTVQPQPDGMATLWAGLSAEAVPGFLSALQQLAARAAVEGDERTQQQREADVLAGLPQLALSALQAADGRRGLPGHEVSRQLAHALAAAGFRTRGRIRAVQAVVLVPAATALGHAQEPAELVGYGPIGADHARRLLDGAELRRAVTERGTGRIVAVDADVVRPAPGQHSHELHRLLALPLPQPPPAEPQHDPSPRLSDLVALRDLTCIGPGGGRASTRTDREHRIPWPRGQTRPENLAPVSRYWHRAKQAGWDYTRSRDGTTTWTSPLGRSYRVPPDRWPPPRSVAAPADVAA